MAHDPGGARPQRAETSEATLLALFGELADGRMAALEGLWDALSDEVHALALWRTGSSADAADVLQAVFVKLAESGRSLRAVRDPRGWVRVLAHRAAVDVHRRRSRRAERPLDEACFVEAATEQPERRVDAQRVSAALHELPPEQREALYLHVHAGCTFNEIGRATGVPTFTAASRCRLALQRLAQRLGATSS